MKLAPREKMILEFLKLYAGRTIPFDAIQGHFGKEQTRAVRNSLMCSLRRLAAKLNEQGSIINRVTRVGRGHKAAFFIDERILKI